MWAIFEKYSQTSDAPKSKVLPISLKQNRKLVFKKILSYVEEEEYDDILPNQDFYEIYFCDKDFEITVTIFDEGAYGSTINISVYLETKRGKSRKKLKEIRQIIVSLFEESDK